MDEQFDNMALSNPQENEYGLLFKSVINTQKQLIVLMHNRTPILFNTAFQKFVGVSTVKEFLREFGSFHNRFVPHDAYFHAGKIDNPEEWPAMIMQLPEDDRIVSMINCFADPHAFLVHVDTPVDGYEIVSFTDISQDLIKRIMIENDVSIDKESGAYNKDYFTHTAKSFHDAAEFNKKLIAITMIELMSRSSDMNAENYLHDFTSSIKSNIRQSDMLVRWGQKSFLIAYLVDNTDNALNFSRKLLNVMHHEPFEVLNEIDMHMGLSVQKANEDIHDIIKRSENAMEQALRSQVNLL